jgi:hypothetical protein
VSYRDAATDDLTDAAIDAADLLGGPIGVYETTACPFLAAEIATIVCHRRDP